MAKIYTEPVKIKSGLIRGEYCLDKQIQVFKGIPYSKAPIGQLRFKNNQETDSWEDVKDCTEFGKSTIQKPLDDLFANLWTEEFVISEREMSEDSLTLNIWTKTGAKKQPVVMYLHGGGYTSGGSSCEIYDGSQFAKEGVIYVSINHREATLGLMAHEELSDKSENGRSGNYILLDEIAALKWIKENIEAFGGDPDNVTIWGQSSGAGEVNALTVSDDAKGLFTKMVSMGYNSFYKDEFVKPWLDIKDSYKMAEGLLNECQMSFEEFCNLDAEKIAEYRDFDRITVGGNALDNQFDVAINNGNSNHIVSLMGAVPGDSMMCARLFKGIKITDKESFLTSLQMYFEEYYEEANGIYGLDLAEDIKAKKAEIQNDMLIATMLLYARARIKADINNKTYLYFFKHVLPGPYAPMFGAFHSSEVPYFMNYFSKKRDEYWSDTDKKLGLYMNKQLATFIKSGQMDDSNWIPSDGSSYLLIDDNEQALHNMPEKKIKLWTKAFEKHKTQ